MAVRLARFGLVLVMVVAMVLVFRAIATGASHADIESAAPIAAKQPIYRPQQRNLF